MSGGRVLVIKHGALGDFVQATGPFAAIRRHHADREIVLLTTPPFAAFARASPYFDEVWTDRRASAVALSEWRALRRRLRDGGFGRVYDLQTSDRSSFYFRLFWPGPYPEWSGIAGGCSHPHANPRRDALHTIDRQAEQLAIAGIATVPPPDLTWANADIGAFGLADRVALLAAGGAAHRPGKRWPRDRYAALARWLVARGLQPVLVGTAGEAELIEEIRAACPEAVSLAERTSLIDLVALARRATAAVGNDTGPMHLASVAGCPTLVLYSSESDPALCGQRGAHVLILRRPRLADLAVDDVVRALVPLLDRKAAVTEPRTCA